ncbi:AfsR/SARP family transcriptional regulator [Allokutzneria oryzae]|uniref:BTAD domain-containing putative transcriptional regulator n=1 Tax=Allokutzneria oryzae TaxID=1378989 RepID=A0ABV6A0X0_9PSEU
MRSPAGEARELEFRLLGQVEVLAAGVPVALGGAGVRRLLALLVLEANQVVGRGRIAEVLWEDEPPSTSRTIIQGYVSKLRKLLGAVDPAGRVEIITRSSGYQLRVDHDLIDLRRATALIDRARGLPPAGRAELLAEALRLWRGPVLGGVTAGRLEHVVYELEELRLVALEDRIAADLELGRHAELVVELSGLLSRHPFRERMVSQLVLALHRSGRRATALSTFQGFTTRLADELGIDPGPQLRALHERVVRDDPSLRWAPATSEQSSSVPRRPAQLPPTPAGFTGREREVAALDALLVGRDERPSPVIATVVGAAGVGKSALAVTWSRLVAPEFPDGQLFAGLHGFDPEHPAAEPTQVLRKFLIALGVAPEAVPVEEDERVALYRSLLAGRRMLVLLDDARDSEQVRPLLPGDSGSLVLVTSRRRLGGLAVSVGASVLTLDTLPEAEAVRIIEAAAGDRAVSEAPQLRLLAELCGGLPLALRIVAARLAVNPDRPAADLVAELSDERDRLAALDTEDDDISVRGVFDVSYRHLSEQAATLFRLIGLVPGREVTPLLVAAMAGIEPSAARRGLRSLAAAHLISEQRPDRFVMHDLLRLHGRERARTDLTERDRAWARQQLVLFYLATADLARRSIRPAGDDLSFPAAPGHQLPEVGTPAAALEWFDAELGNLLELQRGLLEDGQDAEAWVLPRLMLNFLSARFLVDEWITTHRRALPATDRLADPHAEVSTRIGLTVALARANRHAEALEQAMAARTAAKALGSARDIATTTANVGMVLMELARFTDALSYVDEALRLAEASGDTLNQASCMLNLGFIQKALGDTGAAVDGLRKGIELSRRTGDRETLALGLVWLGDTMVETGDVAGARRLFAEALEISEHLGVPVEQARARRGLGDVALANGDPATAAGEWSRALELFERLGLAEVETVRSRLSALSAQENRG